MPMSDLWRTGHVFQVATLLDRVATGAGGPSISSTVFELDENGMPQVRPLSETGEARLNFPGRVR